MASSLGVKSLGVVGRGNGAIPQPIKDVAMVILANFHKPICSLFMSVSLTH